MTGRANDHRRSRRGDRVPHRARHPRPFKTRILIVGEGRETEPNNFHGLRESDFFRADLALVVKKGPGWSAEAVVEAAIRHKRQATAREEDYDEVWCVLDVETPPDKRNALEQATALAGQEGITLCLSNPCFEVWFITHFVRQSRPYQDADEVMVALNKHWQRQFDQGYQKNDDQVFHRLEPHIQTALHNARLVRETDHATVEDTADANSSTEVYRLIKAMG